MRVAVAVASCLVAAGLGLSVVAAVRALRSNPIVPTSPKPTQSRRALASPPISPSSPVFRPALGAACLVQEVNGDFDGDRLEDVAFTWMPEPTGGCPPDPPFGPFVLTVFRAGGRGRADLQITDRCDGQNCGYLAKADLNGDGKGEIATVTRTGAADDFYKVFGFVDGKLVALPVAPPGAKGYAAGAPIELDVGGSALIQSYVTCEKSDEWGGIVLLAHGFTAHPGEQGSLRWRHRETGFHFDGRAFTVLYQDSPEEFPDSYDPSRDSWLKELSCWPAHR
jgi:hypothetical protein